VPDAWKEEFRFTQGQNITLRTILDGMEVRRSYSICSSPFDNELRVAIKQAENGKFSTFANTELTKDSFLEVLPPTGVFFTRLDPGQKKNYLAIAAGSGITPVISIIKTTLLAEQSSNFTLIYANRSRNSIIFKEELEAIKNRHMDRFSVFHVLTRERTDAPILHGRIDEKKCAELFGKMPDLLRSDEIFLCGPEQMIFTIQKWMDQNGMNKSRIHFELFTVPGQNEKRSTEESVKEPGPEEKKSKITVRSDGLTYRFDLAYEGETILNAALRQGADLPFSCKGGVCATCRARLLEGKVEMDTNYALESEELAAGYILTCQAHPRTPNVSVDYDRTG
jgi:ring-1,2-phenylacetyl-CoA epoxidase subunit PaaE